MHSKTQHAADSWCTAAVQPRSQVACFGSVPAAHIIYGPICQALKAAAVRQGLCHLRQGLCLLHDGLDALEGLPGGGPQLDVHLQAAAHTQEQCVRYATCTAAVSQVVCSSALQLDMHHQAAARGQCLREVVVCSCSATRRLARCAAAVPAAVWAAREVLTAPVCQPAGSA